MRQLILGNLNYSSWSIRPLLVARHVGLPVEEKIVPLDFPETTQTLNDISPTAKVPLLIWDDLTIWDSLAITEWIAEWAPDGQVWPADPAKRAEARAVTAEMHSGFSGIRKNCPVDIRARTTPLARTAELDNDVARIDQLWTDLRTRFAADGDFLFGQWSAADAFYAPVVTRFRTYDLPMSDVSRAYSATVFADPKMQTLEKEAKAEPWFIKYDADGRSSGYVNPEES